MSKPLNGRLESLALIAPHGAELVYGGQGWVAPNKWISNAIIADFLERELVRQNGNRIEVTAKGIAILAEKKA